MFGFTLADPASACGLLHALALYLLDAHLMRCYMLSMTSSSQHPHEVGIAADPPTAGDAEGERMLHTFLL